MRVIQTSGELGLEIVWIRVGMGLLRVLRAPKAEGRYTLIECPGPIRELCVPAERIVGSVCLRIAQEACQFGRPTKGVAQDSGVATLVDGRSTMLVAPLSDGSWTVRRAPEGDPATVQQGSIEVVLEVIRQEAERIFAHEVDRRIQTAFVGSQPLR